MRIKDSEDLLLKNVSVPIEGGVRTVDMLVRDGRFHERGENLSPGPTTTVRDCTGLLLLPGLVDGHVHLDKTLWGAAWSPSQLPKVPALSDLVNNERRMRAEGKLDPRVCAPRLLEEMTRRGTTALRSHIDIDPTTRLDGVRALLEVRESFKDRIDIEFVAFPQSGILCSPGVEELLDEALKMGVEAIGGLDPAAFDRDPARHLDIVFRLAAEHGVKVDIHLHEPGTLGAFSIELIAERTRKYGLQGKVAISHAFALGTVEENRFKKLLELIAETRLALVTNAPGSSEFAPHKPVLEAGIVYALGSDNIRDCWAPFGNGDMLDRALQLVMRRRLRSDGLIEQALSMATYEGAKLLGLKDYGIEPGCFADGVLLKAACAAEAVAVCPGERTVLKRGQFLTEK